MGFHSPWIQINENIQFVSNVVHIDLSDTTQPFVTMEMNPGADLVFGVGDHGRLPFSIHVLVPILRLLGIGVRDVFCFVPVLQFKGLVPGLGI